MNLDAISRAANENTDPDPSDRDFGELMANALRVCLDDLLANRGPMTDDQRKAMFARLGGGGSSPRASKWYDKDVLKAGAQGFWEGANDAAEKGLAKLSFGLTDKIGFTDSTRPELQWSGYDAADQNAEFARKALITALGIKAGTLAWNAWKAKQAAAATAAAAGTWARKFTSTGQHFWNNPGAWKAHNLTSKLEASQERLIRKALTHGVDKKEADYIREIWDKKDLFRNPGSGGPIEWRDVASAYGFDGPRLDAALRVIEQGARPASSNPLGTLAAREAALARAVTAVTSQSPSIESAARSHAIQQAIQNYGYDAQFDNQLIDRLTESALSGMRALGNRAPSTLLETAIRVARTPDAVLANARRPLTDEQKRAIFAKSGGGGLPKVTPAMLERLRKRITGEK